MGYDIDVINPVHHKGWDELVTGNEGCTFFHTAAWANVLCQTYHYEPLYFTHLENGRLSMLTPMMEVKSILTGRRGVSLPFTDYCEPICENGSHVGDMTDFIREYGQKRRWSFIESRGGSHPDATASTSFYRHCLDLTPGAEKLFSKFKSNARTSVRKAIREGVQVEMRTSPEAVEEYYRLHCMTRKRHGLPPQPHAFFKKLYEHIISRKLGFVALASYNRVHVSGSIFLSFKDKAIYKYGATDFRYQHVRPADLVMSEAIKWYAENGYRSLCFGRTAIDNEGLRRFKNRWGTNEQIVNYYKFDLRQNAFLQDTPRAGDLGHRVFSKMPIPVLRALGALLYKHMG